MVFPLLKTWLKPWLPSTMNSGSNRIAYKYDVHGSGFVTIGGGGASASNRSRPDPQSCDVSRNMTFDNESEEHIVKSGAEINMQPLQTSGGRQRLLNGKNIVVQTHVSVTTEDASSQKSGKSF
jgi:hypothetical protein